MKRFVIIFFIFIITLVLYACDNSAVVVGADGKEYELVEDKNGSNESVSQSGVVVAGQDENGNAVTTVLSDDYLIVDNDTIKTPAYNYEIPKDFEIKSKGTSPLFENKQGTVQLNIMDKTGTVTDFDDYIIKTYNSYKSIGNVKDELKDVTVAGADMKRFAVEISDGDGTALTTYTYAAEIGGRALMITVTSKDGGLAEAERFDEIVAGIDFTK